MMRPASGDWDSSSPHTQYDDGDDVDEELDGKTIDCVLYFIKDKESSQLID